MKRIISGLIVALVLVGMLALAFNVQLVEAQGTVFTDDFNADRGMWSLVQNVVSTEFGKKYQASAQLPYPGYPFVSVYPYNEICPVDQTFTISVIAYNLTNKQVPDPYNPFATIPLGNLYGFDLQLTWDPTIIHCINHTVTTPVERYSTPIPPSPYAGVLHGYGTGNRSLVYIKDVVNESGIVGAAAPDVKAWFSYATMTPASVFNGNGTIATMTFKVLKKNVGLLQIVSVMLTDETGTPIGYSTTQVWLNPPHDGTVNAPPPHPSAPSHSPSVGVVNKPMYFSTSVTGNYTDVAKYMWNFGDGKGIQNTTTSTVPHNYTSSNTYTVTVTVADVDGTQGSNSTLGVMVAASRDLEATSVTLPQSYIVPNRTLTVTTVASNLGSAGFTFYENCLMRLYYNASSLGSNTAWVQVGTGKNVTIPNGVSNSKQVSFSLNSSSLPKLETYYYFKFNVTGIPSGYEANTANNAKVSTALLYTAHAPTRTHDTAVTNVTPFKTIVGQGYSVKINVTATDPGGYTETFNVTAYANATAIATQTVTLTSGNSTALTFTWNTKGFTYGNYTISAYAWPVLGETNTVDNTLKAHVSMEVTIPGDVDGNYVVSIVDVVKITSIYASKQGDPKFNPNSDIDGDGKITILDVVICTSHYAQKWP